MVLQARNIVQKLIDYREIRDLQPKDMKELSDLNYEKLKASLESNGMSFPKYVWLNPEDNHYYYIDGHQTSKVLRKEKAVIVREGKETYEILCDVIEAKDIKEAKSLLLSATSQYGLIQENVLMDFMKDLDIELIKNTAFDIVDIDKLIANMQNNVESIGGNENLEDGYEVPEDIDSVNSDFVEGDLVTFESNGKVLHSLYVGDSTHIESWKKLTNNFSEMFWLWVTDPPYNVNYTGGTKDQLTIKNDNFENSDDFYNFIDAYYKCMSASSHAGCSAYIFHSDNEGATFRSAFKKSGFHLSQCLIWLKNQFVLCRQDYHWQHEPILYGWKEGAGHKWYGNRSESTVIPYDKPQRNGEHPTMKPVELVEHLISNSSEEGNLVGDGFLGSGTTMVASHKLGRRCLGCELDPKYAQVIVNRMMQLDSNLSVKVNGKEYERLLEHNSE